MFKKAIAGIMSMVLVLTSLTLPVTTEEVDAAVYSSNGTNGWTVVWSDEFNGSSVDTNNWTYEIGNGDSGWGNNELEYYTDRTDNAYVSDGSLHIVAKRESYNGYNYTSARIKTQNKQIFQYGRVESRIKFTNCMQNAMWPAFWMLGNDITSVGWPSCGEIDIFEHANSNTHVGGTFHWTGQYGYQYSGGNSQSTFGDGAWHTYAVEWYEDCIKWYLDDNNYYTLDITNSYMDEAHKQHFILLNFAIGGPGSGYTGYVSVPDSFTSAEMEVDYVRVYQGSDSSFKYNNQSGVGGTSSDGWTNYGSWSIFQGSAINWTTGAATMTGGQTLDNFTVNMTNSGAATSDGMWAVQAKASDVSVTPNVTNRMSFTITSDKAKTIWVLAENSEQTKYLNPTAINLSPGTNTYSYEFVPAEDNVNIIFAMGYDSGDVAAAESSANIAVTNFKIGTITTIPGTVSIGSYVDKTSSITLTTENNVTYAGGLNDGSYLDYFVNVPEAGDYTINLKLAAGDSQWNAQNMLVKINGSTAATIPVQASSSWTTFVDHTATINFSTAGVHTISVAAVSGACNVTDFTLTKNSTTETPTEAPTTAATVTGQCDLVVTDIYTDKTYYAGEEAQFVVKIKNQGTAATPSGTKHGLLLYVNGTAVNWCDTYLDSMEPGAEATLVMNYGPNNKATWTVPSAGTYTVQAWIDDQSLITESNEDNNRLEKSITFTDKPAETTTAPQVEEPSEVFGLEVTAIDYNTISVVWGSNSDKEAKGQLYNVYIDGVKKLSNVAVGLQKFENISAGTHTVKVTAVLNGTETAGATTTVTVEDEPVVSSDVAVEINGYQISTTVEGFRTVYSINDPNNEVVSAGMLYGIGNIAESNMVYGATGVYNFGATDAGKLDATFSSYANAQSYSMTMQFAKTASFYTTKMNVRAYAKLSDGTYVYSDVEAFTVFYIADFLYQNLLMNNLDGHDYLYNNILSVVDSTYKEKDFAWNNSIVNPDII